MRSPRDAFRDAIERWEGLFQNQPQDAGNYVTMPDGSRRLVGTMRGVTPPVLAAHRGIPAHTVTVDMMRTVSLDEAVDIGMSRFYRGTGLDLLPWGPATEAIVDFGWGSGPVQAVRTMQRLCGAKVDGVVGPRTIDAYSAWVSRLGWEAATQAVCEARKAFYNLIIGNNPDWEIYRRGWYNRAEWFTRENGTWWAHWLYNMPPLPGPAAPEALPLPPTAPAPTAPIPPDDDEEKFGKRLAIGAGVVGSSVQAIQAFLAANWVPAVVLGVVILGVSYMVYRHFEKKAERTAEKRRVGV